MLLIPIGHEELSIRRLPWVTITIALICGALRMYATTIEDSAVGGVIDAAHRLNTLVNDAAEECWRRDDCPLDQEADPEEVVQLLREKKIGDPAQQELFAALERRYHEDLARHPSRRLGFQPGDFSVLELFTYMFAHGSFMHLLGNMLFLYLMGLTIEERWGRLRFLVFYLAGGVASALAYGALHPGSATPLVGASGAIAALMGAFAVLYSRTKIKFFYFIWIKTGVFRASAWIVLPLWFVQQLWSISAEVSGEANVGYSAHAGGFVFGAFVAVLIRAVGLDRIFKYESDIASGRWAEDPNFLDAESHAEKQEYREAAEKLARVLDKDPRHRGALELAHHLAMRTGDAAVAERVGPQLYPDWARTDPRRIVESYRLVTVRRTAKLEEPTLDHVLAAATAISALDVAEDVLRRLYARDPESVRVARALFAVAELHLGMGHVELAAKFLERISTGYGSTVWAEKARNKLRELELR